MKSIIISIIGFSIVCFYNFLLYAQEVPFESNSITSSYGPRIHPVDKVYNFHVGIDYGQPEGKAIQSVEAGVITKIGVEEKSGWVLGIKAKSGDWSYLHLFKNGLPNSRNQINSGIFSLEKDSKGLFIRRKKTEKWPKAKLRKELTIKANEPIAPVGNSGVGTGPHLHLNLNHGNDNPLSVLKHTEGEFKVTMQYPKEGAVLSGDELIENFPVRVRIDSKASKDLDKVILFLDGKPVGDQGEPTFCFGGNANEEQKLMQPSLGVNSGVVPLKGFVRDFVYNCDFSDMEEGEHTIKVRTKNVNDKVCESISKFIIEKEKEGMGMLDVEYPYEVLEGFTGKKLPIKYHFSFTNLKTGHKNKWFKWSKDNKGEYNLNEKKDLKISGKAHLIIDYPNNEYKKDGAVLINKIINSSSDGDVEMVFRKNENISKTEFLWQEYDSSADYVLDFHFTPKEELTYYYCYTYNGEGNSGEEEVNYPDGGFSLNGKIDGNRIKIYGKSDFLGAGTKINTYEGYIDLDKILKEENKKE